MRVSGTIEPLLNRSLLFGRPSSQRGIVGETERFCPLRDGEATQGEESGRGTGTSDIRLVEVRVCIRTATAYHPVSSVRLGSSRI